MLGLRFANEPRRRVFSPPLDVTPGGRPASRFIWRTTDVSNTPSRWPGMSRPARPSFTTEQRTRLHWVRWSESDCDVLDSKLRLTPRNPLLHPPLARSYHVYLGHTFFLTSLSPEPRPLRPWQHEI